MARTIREMGVRRDIDTAPLWKFINFVSMFRSPLYTLLTPFIQTIAQTNAENEHELRHQLNIR